MKQGRSARKKYDAGRGKSAATEDGLTPSVRRKGQSSSAGLAQVFWPAAILIFLAVIVIYLPALHGAFLWEDDSYVSQNLTLHTLGGLGQIWFNLGATPQYYPLVFSSFWLEYHLWGLQPFGFHLVNALLHAGSAVLLWQALRRLGVRGAWLAGLLFAVHPVAAESVAWITERKNVLSTFFYLLSFITLVRFYGLDREREPEQTWGSWTLYGLAIVLFTGALFSKTVTGTLPAALIIVLWWKRGRLKTSELLPLIPLFVMGAAMGLLAAWVEQHFVRAQGVDWTLTPLTRCLLAARAIWFYLVKLAVPAGLTFVYPRWKIDAHAVWQYFFPLALLALFVWLWLGRRRFGRAPLAALAFFVVTLVPALGFVDGSPMRYSFVADHFQYLAMLGPLALAGALCSAGLDQLAPLDRPKGMAAFAALIVLLGAITWNQAGDYLNLTTLWTNNLARNSESTLALNNLGMQLVDKGEMLQAQEYFQRALTINPKYAEAHVNMGLCLEAQNHVAEALDHDTQAQRLNPADPRTPYNIGNLLAKLSRWDEAIAAYKQSLALDPGLLRAQFNLAAVLSIRHNYAEALHHWRCVQQLSPGEPNGAERLAWLLAAAPDPRLRNGAEAVALAEDACHADAENPRYLDTLGIARAEAGLFTEAIQAAQKALGLAQATKNEPLAREITARLQLYQARRPYHEDALAPPSK